MSKASALSKKLKKISDALEKRYGKYEHVEFDDFIETMMHQILALGADSDMASKALEAIHGEFVDWNDMRMATVREIEDILGDDYPRCREKAEDVINLLADLYTAFRKMVLNEVAPTEEGMQTLRALPETTLVRRDMVEHALNVVFNIPTFAADELQIDILKLLGGLPNNMELEDCYFTISQALIDEEVTIEELRQLSHGLRCHADFLVQYNIHDPKPIGYGWDKPDPLGMKVPKFKSEVQKMEPIDPIKPAPKPLLDIFDDDDDEEDEEKEIDPDLDLLVVADDDYGKSKLEGTTDEQAEPNADSKPEDSDDDDGLAPIEADIKEDAAVEKKEEDAPAAKKKTAAKKKSTEKGEKPAAKKEPAKKKAAAKKTAAKKEPAKKKAAAKKEPAKKKSAAKKTAAKKEPAKKKAAAKKTAAKKEPAKKKAAAKKTAAKKTPAKKKAAAKKSASKKSAAKKAAPKKKK